MSGDVSPEEAVANFRQAVVKATHSKQRIVINRKAESVVREALRIYKKQINIASEPDVAFKNEDAIDATGLTRVLTSHNDCSSEWFRKYKPL